jgi:hypothetical protein
MPRILGGDKRNLAEHPGGPTAQILEIANWRRDNVEGSGRLRAGICHAICLVWPVAMKHGTNSLIGITLALLAACSSVPVVPPVDIAELDSRAYAAFERGDLAAARDAFAQLIQQTDGDSQRGYQIELARTEIRLGAAAAALARLDAIAPPVPDSLRPALMAVRAEALFAVGDPIAAVRLLVEREIWLDTPEAIRDNQARIWNGLAASPNALEAGFPTGDTMIDGWLALAPLTRLVDNETDFRAALIAWGNDYPEHPARAGILAERLAALRGDSVRPTRVALLLPLGGEGLLRLRAEAIRDGFFAAYLATDRASAPEIQVLDTLADGALAAYRAAQLAGADFIVGPLRAAEEVDVILPEVGFIPTLALNLASSETVPANNFFQYALSSDDEIEAIATQAIAAGHHTAVILHASNDRGYRLMRGFREAFESRGGQIIDSRAYASDASNHATAVKELLNVAQSEARYDRLDANLRSLGRGIEFEPRRRADIDMIFLQADPASGPEDARLLLPLLAGNDAAGIATYATPEVYDPTRERRDSDLDGLIFPDLPLLVDPVGDAQTAAELLAEFTSRSAADYRRLWAFGFDAYRLAEALFADDATGWPVAGATGELYLGENGRIRRILPFAEFSGGRPVALRPLTDFLSLR